MQFCKYICFNKYIENFISENFFKEKLIYRKDICERCGNQVNTYKAINLNSDLFRLEYNICPVCGVKSILPLGTTIDISIEKNNDIFLSINIKSNIKFNTTNAYLIFNLNDKSDGRNIIKQIKIVNLNESIRIKIDKSDNLGSDLHAYKAILLCDLNIIYFRGRFQF